jgi:hypothetical protein
VTHAIQKCDAVNEKCHGYHCAMLAIPENTMKIPPATRGNNPTRSTRSLIRLAGGNDTNRGQTTQSLASNTGIDAIPDATWMPWLIRYRPIGRVGMGNQDCGCCCRCENSPVTKHTLKRIPSEAPSQAATRSSRNALA